VRPHECTAHKLSYMHCTQPVSCAVGLHVFIKALRVAYTRLSTHDVTFVRCACAARALRAVIADCGYRRRQYCLPVGLSSFSIGIALQYTPQEKVTRHHVFRLYLLTPSPDTHTTTNVVLSRSVCRSQGDAARQIQDDPGERKASLVRGAAQQQQQQQRGGARPSAGAMTRPKGGVAETVQPFVCGGLAACCASTFIHPIDLAKVRIQLMSTLRPDAPKVSFPKLISTMVREEGVTR
jgi:Mitochondrial carrier protein